MSYCEAKLPKECAQGKEGQNDCCGGSERGLIQATALKRNESLLTSVLKVSEVLIGCTYFISCLKEPRVFFRALTPDSTSVCLSVLSEISFLYQGSLRIFNAVSEFIQRNTNVNRSREIVNIFIHCCSLQDIYQHIVLACTVLQELSTLFTFEPSDHMTPEDDVFVLQSVCMYSLNRKTT